MSRIERRGLAAYDTSKQSMAPRQAAEPPGQTISLGRAPLSSMGVARALHGRTGTRPSPATVQAVHTATGGCALFLSALLAGVRSAEALATWQDAAHVPVPTAAQTSILRALYGLPQAERALVMFAASLGRHVELGRLAYVTGVARDSLWSVLTGVPRLLRPATHHAESFVFTSGFAQAVIAASLPPMTTGQLREHFGSERAAMPPERRRAAGAHIHASPDGTPDDPAVRRLSPVTPA